MSVATQSKVAAEYWSPIVKLPEVVEVAAPVTVAVLAVTVSAPAPSAMMSTRSPTGMSVLAFTVTTVADPLVNKIVLPASVEVSVRAVVASTTRVARPLAVVSTTTQAEPSYR